MNRRNFISNSAKTAAIIAISPAIATAAVQLATPAAPVVLPSEPVFGAYQVWKIVAKSDAKGNVDFEYYYPESNPEDKRYFVK